MSNIQDAMIGARLSIQRALLGEVSAQLRAVVFSIVNRNLNVRFYFDGMISKVDEESASCVETEILADYEPDELVTVCCIRLDAPEPIMDDGVWVYWRREPSSD
jgi:hypothetical protein